MQTNTASQTKAPAVSATSTIPAHVLERLENEWRQMRTGSAQPSSASK